MNTKIFSIVLTMLLCMTGISAFAQTEYYNYDHIRYLLNTEIHEATAVGLAYDDYEGLTFTIASTFTVDEVEYTVTAIADYAFHRKRISSISLPNTLLSIGDLAFYECHDLSSITIPKSVNHIGENVFLDCESLNRIEVDPENETYDSRNNCHAIIETKTNKIIAAAKYSTIPNGVEIIGKEAFRGIDKQTITIPETVKAIEANAFQNCSVTSLTIPSSVKTIDYGAFTWCTEMESITLNEGLDSLGYGAFFQCWNLKNIVLPESLKKIGKQAFYGCESLAHATLPTTMTKVPYEMFEGCTALKNIVLPDGLKIIGSSAFTNCGFESFTIPDGVTRIEGNAFRGTRLFSLVIPNSVQYIGYAAFSAISNLTSVVIGSGLTLVDGHVFNECRNLTTVVSLSSNPINIPGKDNPEDIWHYFPSFYEDVFDEATLFVPVGTIGLYQARQGWRDFANIFEGIPEDATNVNRVKNCYISGETNFEFSSEITITCETEGATILYCTSADGETYTDYQPYTGPFTITSTTYVKAKAYKDGMLTSNIMSETFVQKDLGPDVPNILATRAAANGSMVTTKGIVTSCTVSGTKATAFIQDATAAICVYGASGIAEQMKPGNLITVTGKTTMWKSNYRIDYPEITVIGTGYTIPEPEVMTTTEIQQDWLKGIVNCKQGKLIMIVKAQVSWMAELPSWINIEVKQGDNVIFVQELPKDLGIEIGDYVTLVGNLAADGNLKIFNSTVMAIQKAGTESGDANGDGETDVADVVAIVNYILENPDKDFNAAAADINGDGMVDVADIVALVNIILNKK